MKTPTLSAELIAGIARVTAEVDETIRRCGGIGAYVVGRTPDGVERSGVLVAGATPDQGPYIRAGDGRRWHVARESLRTGGAS